MITCDLWGFLLMQSGLFMIEIIKLDQYCQHHASSVIFLAISSFSPGLSYFLSLAY
jgi:hypothetical protein